MPQVSGNQGGQGGQVPSPVMQQLSRPPTQAPQAPQIASRGGSNFYVPKVPSARPDGTGEAIANIGAQYKRDMEKKAREATRQKEREEDKREAQFAQNVTTSSIVLNNLKSQVEVKRALAINRQIMLDNSAEFTGDVGVKPDYSAQIANYARISDEVGSNMLGDTPDEFSKAFAAEQGVGEDAPEGMRKMVLDRAASTYEGIPRSILEETIQGAIASGEGQKTIMGVFSDIDPSTSLIVEAAIRARETGRVSVFRDKLAIVERDMKEDMEDRIRTRKEAQGGLLTEITGLPMETWNSLSKGGNFPMTDTPMSANAEISLSSINNDLNNDPSVREARDNQVPWDQKIATKQRNAWTKDVVSQALSTLGSTSPEVHQDLVNEALMLLTPGMEDKVAPRTRDLLQDVFLLVGTNLINQRDSFLATNGREGHKKINDEPEFKKSVGIVASTLMAAGVRKSYQDTQKENYLKVVKSVRKILESGETSSLEGIKSTLNDFMTSDDPVGPPSPYTLEELQRAVPFRLRGDLAGEVVKRWGPLAKKAMLKTPGAWNQDGTLKEEAWGAYLASQQANNYSSYPKFMRREGDVRPDPAISGWDMGNGAGAGIPGFWDTLLGKKRGGAGATWTEDPQTTDSMVGPQQPPDGGVNMYGKIPAPMGGA